MMRAGIRAAAVSAARPAPGHALRAALQAVTRPVRQA